MITEFLPDRRFMLAALKLAREALADGEVPVGAVIERGGEIIGSGRNRREKGKNALLHAEIEAIGKACKTVGDWRLTGANLYVTLEPCPMCAGAAVGSRIGRIVFGAEDALFGACGSQVDLLGLPGSYHPARYRGFFEEDCRALLQSFFTAMRQEKD